MAESNFVDYVKIYCRSGKGGRGSTHMRREKYCPNGGPDGGDGGRGGHIILRGNRNYWTLLHLKYDRHAMAGHGESGSKGRSFGKDGADKIIEVPCGTVVYNAETGEYLCDVTEDGQEVVLLKGGRGGQGNWHFKTATRQAPRFAQPGEPMQEMTVIMELKLLADVGLVGFPNAGKSTFFHFGCQTENCRLPVYYARTQLGHRFLSRWKILCDGGHTGYYRRSQSGKRFGTAFLASYRA